MMIYIYIYTYYIIYYILYIYTIYIVIHEYIDKQLLCQADFYGLKSLYGFIGGPTVQAAMMLETPGSGPDGRSAKSIDRMPNINFYLLGLQYED